MSSDLYDLNDLPADRDGLETMLDRVNGEIADITAQLQIEEREEGDEAWASSARKARSFRFKLKATLERRLAALDGPVTRLSVAEAKLEATRLNHAAAVAKAESKARNVEQSNTRERERLKALLNWLKDNHPGLWDEAVLMLNGAEAAGGEVA